MGCLMQCTKALLLGVIGLFNQVMCKCLKHKYTPFIEIAMNTHSFFSYIVTPCLQWSCRSHLGSHNSCLFIFIEWDGLGDYCTHQSALSFPWLQQSTYAWAVLEWMSLYIINILYYIIYTICDDRYTHGWYHCD